MGVADPIVSEKIKQFLKWQHRGMTISDLTSKLKINRNLVAKHLDLLLVSGSIEMRHIGPAKVFFLSNRIPISGLLEFSSDLVIVLDHENTIRRINEQALMVLGLNKSEIVGKKIRETGNIFLDSLPSIEPHLETHDIKERTCELSHQVNGEPRSFRIKTIATTLEDASHGTTLVIEDITDRQRYQELLEKSAAQYRGIVEDQSDFIIRFLPDGMIVFSNTSYARYLGKTSDGITGRQFLAGICEEDRNIAWESIKAVTPQEPVATLHYRVLHEGMTPRWNQWTVRGLFHESGALREYQAVGQDITEKQAASEKIRAYIGGMEFLSRSATAFIDMGEDEDIYRFIAEQLFALVPDSMISINSFDPKTRTMMLRAVKGSDEDIARLYHELGDYGRKLGELMLPIDINPDAIASFRKHSLEDCPPLYDMFFHQIPEEICTRVENRLPLGRGYTMGFVCRGGIFGSVIIKMKKGAELKNRRLVEAFISQAAVALLRRHARKELRASEEARLKNMAFLSRTAMAFIDMGDDEDIYRFITEQIHGFCPDLAVGANSFDMVRGTATLRSISGFNHGTMKKFSEWHVNPIGMEFPLKNDMSAEEIVSRKCLTPGPARLYDLFFRTVPEKVCLGIEDLITWGGCYAMGVVCRGEIFGSIVLIVQKGKTLENKETIEAFISQAGFALLHRRTLESVSAPTGKSAENMK